MDERRLCYVDELEADSDSAKERTESRRFSSLIEESMSFSIYISIRSTIHFRNHKEGG